MEHEETRKGPWTEHEDLQLAYFVHLFGERRWDFIAKVSGLNRSGKSCRLRWVNYLHPGLKRGRMTLQEERIILELHSKWGNRWSRIARKLPGRTDNEIKNYWRTHTRKKAQQMKLRSGSSSSNLQPPRCSDTISKLDLQEKLDSGGEAVREEEDADGCYNMDQIWKEIDSSSPSSSEEIVNSFSCLTMASPLWVSSYSEELCCSEEDIMMLVPTTTHFDSYFENGRD